MRIYQILIFMMMFSFSINAGAEDKSKADTLVVTAEGLADPNAETYRKDKGLLVDALRQDARKQVIEKAVGAFVDSSTLVQNYVLINDRVLTQSKGFIKQVLQESEPWQGEDGFMHLLLKAEVYLKGIQEALQTMSKTERISLLKEYDNPKISVAVYVRDAERGENISSERSDIAENVLKEHFKSFGYRVQSEEISTKLKEEAIERSLINNQNENILAISHLKSSDFSVIGEAKFTKRSAKIAPSNITLTSHILTSWTVKCVDNYTGEEIYFNNKVPRKKAWSHEDQALEDIGRLIGQEFSKDFFETHLSQLTKIYQLQVIGLPNYELAKLLKREMIGLRPVVKVDLRNFSAEAYSMYEVEFTGNRNNFTDVLQTAVLSPLNIKFGENALKMTDASGSVVKVSFQTTANVDNLVKKINELPPSSLATAPPERINTLVQDEKLKKSVSQLSVKQDIPKSRGLPEIDKF